MASVASLFELVLTIVYIKMALAEITWKIEDNFIKYRSLYDRIIKSEKVFNKLYNLIYLIAKILIVVTFVLELEDFAKYVILVFPLLFFV